MAFASCAHYEHGYFTAYRRLAEDHPDLVLHLGDYMYEYRRDTYAIAGGNPRDHAGPGDRRRWPTTGSGTRSTRPTPTCRPRTRSRRGWWCWDDHEVENNWADEVPRDSPDAAQPTSCARRDGRASGRTTRTCRCGRASVPAGHRHAALPAASGGASWPPSTCSTPGSTATTRRCGDGYAGLPGRRRPGAARITGAAQETLAARRLPALRPRWDILGQQVFFAQRDNNAGPARSTSHGRAGTATPPPAAADHPGLGRRRACATPSCSPATCTRTGPATSSSTTTTRPRATVGSELVTTSITTGGDGADSDPTTHPCLATNPHLKFYNNQRGYVLTRIERELLTADFGCCRRSPRPGAAAHTKATFVIEDGVPGVQQTYLRPLDPSVRRMPELPAAERIQETVDWETRRP